MRKITIIDSDIEIEKNYLFIITSDVQIRKKEEIESLNDLGFKFVKKEGKKLIYRYEEDRKQVVKRVRM